MSNRKSATFEADSLKQPPHQMAFFKLTFHSPVSKDILCSLCSELMRDPVHTSCCESYFCKECVTRVQGIKRPCPKCYEVKFDVIDDNKSRSMRGKINALRVYCPMSKSGCKWIGPLEGLDRHLKYGDTTIGSGACQFLAVECPNKCGTHVPRGEIPKHIRDRCNLRKVSCPFCGFTDTHDHMTCIHYNICALYPIECPNGCKMPGVQRGEVKDHVENKCPLRTIKCQFLHVGCQSEFKSTDESKHMDDKISYHLGLLSKYCRELSGENMSLRNLCCQLQETFVSLQSELVVQKSTLKQTQLELWSLKLKLPQPLPNSLSPEGEAPSPCSGYNSRIPPTAKRRELRERIYSKPNAFTPKDHVQNHRDDSSEQDDTSLASSGFSSLNEEEEKSKFDHTPHKSISSASSEPNLVAKSQTPPQYDTPRARVRTRHKSTPPESGKPAKPVFSRPIPEVLEPTTNNTPIQPNAPAKLVKPDILPKPTIPPRVAQRPMVKYANLPMVNGMGVANGKVTRSNGKIGSARTLPAKISEELKEVFPAAKTPLGSGNNNEGGKRRESP